MPNKFNLNPIRELGTESGTIDFDEYLGVPEPKTGLEEDLVSVCH